MKDQRIHVVIEKSGRGFDYHAYLGLKLVRSGWAVGRRSEVLAVAEHEARQALSQQQGGEKSC